MNLLNAAPRSPMSPLPQSGRVAFIEGATLLNRAAADGGMQSAAGQMLSSLAEMAIGQACEVVAVLAPAAQADWARRLAEIGFIPGERVRVMARSMPGGDPLAVRIGTSTFALRRAEAACVQVRVLTPGQA